MKLPALSLAALALLVPLVPAKAMPGKGSKKADVMSSLVRADSSPDDDARGKVRFRSKNKKGEPRVRVDVKVLKVDTSLAHHLFLEDGVGVGTFSDLGEMDVDDGALRWSVDSAQGDALPGGAAELGDLTGRRFEVRQGGDVVVEALGPDLSAPKKPVKHKAKLEAPGAEGDGAAKGRLKLRSKADKGQHRLVVKVKKAPFDDADIRLFVEDGVGSDSFLDAGALDRKGSSSKGRYRRSTHHGDPLPLGVADLSALAGRRVQVRADDVVILELELPDPL